MKGEIGNGGTDERREEGGRKEGPATPDNLRLDLASFCLRFFLCLSIFLAQFWLSRRL